MNPIDIHRAWAPPDSPWSPWVKPVLFAHLDPARIIDDAPLPPPPSWLSTAVLPDTRELAYRDPRSAHATAVVIDLPSAVGAELGVAFATLGFQPIPLYNAIPSPFGIVDLLPVQSVLVRGAVRVAEGPRSGPPAFLLDANRMGRGVRAGLIDNRSICRSSDFPSADRLRQAGIRRVLLVLEALEDDLEGVALEWQTAGIALWRMAPTEPAKPIVLREPSFLRRILRRWSHLSFRANLDGTYGRVIEAPASA